MITCPECQLENVNDAVFCGQCARRLIEKEEDNFVGKLINGRYLVKRKIAAGGMGEVYLATQTGIEQDVAIKKLYKHLYREESIVRRFVNEARSYAKITHPNAVKIHDLLNVNGELCIIMEFVRGKTLTQYLKERYHFSLEQILTIAMQLADALGTVHREGIIHRDLKTENIMLQETIPGRFSVKVLDFGIAKIVDNTEHQTEHGLIFGTPEFMSPEQAYGIDIDHRADIYAFGVLLYCMVVEKLPFSGDSKLEILRKQVDEEPPKPKLWDGTPVDMRLEAIILKCLQKKKEDRYQDFSEVITDLSLLSRNKSLAIAVGEDEDEETLLELADGANVERATVAEGSRVTLKELDTKARNDNKRSRDEQPSRDFLLKSSAAYEAVSLVLDDDEFGDGDDLYSDDDGEAHDGDGLSLGELDFSSVGSMETLTRSAPKRSHAGLIAFLVFLLLAAGGAGVYYFVFDGKLPFDLGLSDSSVNAAEQVVESAETQVVQDVEAALETVSEPVPVEQSAFVVEEPEVEEIAPSELMSVELFEYAVVLASMESIVGKLHAGALDESTSLFAAVKAREGLLDEALRKQVVELEELKARYQQMLADAQRQARSDRYDCAAILKHSESLDTAATGMGEKLRQIYNRCEKNRAAPPDFL
ncbi:MAG: serine/threonine-protein kinase [Bradymonadales bacterium]